MRGRKPVPPELKKLRGNPGKRPVETEGPKSDGKAPTCPKHLNAEAKKAWKWLSQTLKGMGILSSSDVAIMTLYCETWSEYVKVRQQVDKFSFVLVSPDTGNPFINPLVNVEAMLKKQMIQYLTELGLSPVSRARVKLSGDSGEDDPLFALMRRRQEHFADN